MGNNASSRRNEDDTSHLAKTTGKSGDGGAGITNNVDKVEKQAIKTKTSIQGSSIRNVASATTTSTLGSAKESAGDTENQRSRQQSTWSFGSLSGRLNWSFTGASRNSSRYRNKSTTSAANKKSFTSLQQRRSKTLWHKPLTNAIFSSHFKDTSRNEQFHIDCLIAKGAFGVVFKVIDKKQQFQPELQLQKGNKTSVQFVYALKVLKKSKIIEENSIQQIKNEADIQKLCGHHPFIVQQIDLWQNRHNLHILSEYVPNGELFSKILNFSIDLIRLYLAEIALAIDFLHNAGIIYRDAKPENILLTETYHIKLTDFGLSKWLKLGTTTKTICGTFQYMAPEIWRGAPYGHAVDWWSLGIIACQMFTNNYPDMKMYIDDTFPLHNSINDLDTVDKAAQNATSDATKLPESKDYLPRQVESLPHAAKDVITRLLEFDPKKRIRSVLTLQRIALYQNYKIDSRHLLSISPLDIISKDHLTIQSMNLEAENSSALATKAFHGF